MLSYFIQDHHLFAWLNVSFIPWILKQCEKSDNWFIHNPCHVYTHTLCISQCDLWCYLYFYLQYHCNWFYLDIMTLNFLEANRSKFNLWCFPFLYGSFMLVFRKKTFFGRYYIMVSCVHIFLFISCLHQVEYKSCISILKWVILWKLLEQNDMKLHWAYWSQGRIASVCTIIILRWARHKI